MRDNAKSGALTEVTFYILLSLYTPKHGYAVMQFVEEKTGGRLSLNCTPHVRQYDILSNKWGVLLCQKEYQTNDIRRNSKNW